MDWGREMRNLGQQDLAVTPLQIQYTYLKTIFINREVIEEEGLLKQTWVVPTKALCSVEKIWASSESVTRHLYGENEFITLS